MCSCALQLHFFWVLWYLCTFAKNRYISTTGIGSLSWSIEQNIIGRICHRQLCVLQSSAPTSYAPVSVADLLAAGCGSTPASKRGARVVHCGKGTGTRSASSSPSSPSNSSAAPACARARLRLHAREAGESWKPHAARGHHGPRMVQPSGVGRNRLPPVRHSTRLPRENGDYTILKTGLRWNAILQLGFAQIPLSTEPNPLKCHSLPL